MKKIIGFMMVMGMVLTLVACGGKGNDTTSQSGSKAEEKVVSDNANSDKDDAQDLEPDYHPVYGQDPLAIIPGNYTATDGKVTAVIKLLEMGSVNVTINEENGANQYTEWSLTGELDDALTISFKDDVMKLVTLDENSIVLNEEVKYLDGSGTVVFDQDSVKFTWNDSKSERGAVSFVRDPD